jgi:hypothetical protein
MVSGVRTSVYAGVYLLARSVTWRPIDRLTRFICQEHVFPPVLDGLEIPDDSAG